MENKKLIISMSMFLVVTMISVTVFAFTLFHNEIEVEYIQAINIISFIIFGISAPLTTLLSGIILILNDLRVVGSFIILFAIALAITLVYSFPILFEFPEVLYFLGDWISETF